MHRIRICFLDTEFEHDIFELIRAFFPEALSNRTADLWKEMFTSLSTA